MSVAEQGKEFRVIGKRLPRVDAKERVTGGAVYPADFTRPGMLCGKILRSPHAHARIISIDASQALALDGVLAVVTADNFPELPIGARIPAGEAGQDIWGIGLVNMARDKVFWRGQPVAAIAAVDRYIAAAALELISVTYDVLKPVMSMAEALKDDAPILHAHMGASGEERSHNIGDRTQIKRGDAAAALGNAAVVGSVEVQVDTAHQGYIEPQAALAEVDANGFLTVWASTQGAFTVELQLAKILDMPQSKLKVVPLEIGGGFGGKIFSHVEPVAARLSQLTQRPVRIVLDRGEVMLGTGPASAADISLSIGADGDGRLTAISGHFAFDSGGLPGTATTLPMQSAAALYQCANLDLVGIDVVTNKPRTEAYRGPGGLQANFAIEQAMDQVAQQLDLDPLELRKRNASKTGDLMPIGTRFPSIGLTTILEQVGAHACWTDPLPEHTQPTGRGLALGYWRGTSMTSASHVTVAGDGTVTVTLGVADVSGTRTTMAQVAAEEFEVSMDDVHVQVGDTKSVGYSDAAAGSRVGRTMAAAVCKACGDALSQLKERAAQKLQLDANAVTYAAGIFRGSGADGPSMSLRELMGVTLTEGAIVGRGVSTNLPLGVEIGAHVCDVAVDTDTGLVTVLRYTAFQDVGRALNPISVEGQIQGSIVQGLGWALSEGYDYDDDGRLRNASLLDYRMPTSLDVPFIECVLIETPVPDVPYGVRGVAEVPILPPPAAVANAIARATGVRVNHLPMTPERVLRALKGAAFGQA